MQYNEIKDSEIPSLQDFLAKQESQHVEPVSNFRDKLIERLTLGVENYGDPLPWEKTEKKYRLRPSEVTIWAGINGHGKSQVLGMVMCWLARDTKVLIASMEMKPEATLERMARQALRTDQPTISYVDKWLDAVSENLYLYTVVGTVQTDRVLAAVHYAATVKGINHVMIDSLATCGIATDDANGQKSFIAELSAAAKQYNIHIHLVHHIRKGRSEEDIPDKFDVKGAGELVDLTDNLVIVYRNKKNERQQEPDPEMFDCMLKIDKQRHGEWEGSFMLWFHPKSMQYTPDSRNQPMIWGEL
jgi:twinkle protein